MTPTLCPGCNSAERKTERPRMGTPWTQYACGAVYHPVDDDLSRTHECRRREAVAMRADLDMVAAEGRR